MIAAFCELAPRDDVLREFVSALGCSAAASPYIGSIDVARRQATKKKIVKKRDSRTRARFA